MLLKEVSGLYPELKDSPIVQSPIWNKNVSELHPVQLIAIRKKSLNENPSYDIDLDLNFLVKILQLAELDDILTSPLSRYIQPSTSSMTTHEFVQGLRNMAPEYRMAVIFGLEMRLSAIRVSNLTVGQICLLENKTKLAQEVISNILVSNKTMYAFWTVRGDEHDGLDDLGEIVYEAFGCSWMELSARYRNMIADHYNPLIILR
ncbi:hypothetical protein [Acinetobacter brisouii]|uniref:hypothetical protein n=1 Tax=Acinetobacter brisouii TaxID=396323 RepID=UPI00124E8B0B|nr:hypothetical protein [Acinetobacter brisouii]